MVKISKKEVKFLFDISRKVNNSELYDFATRLYMEAGIKEKKQKICNICKGRLSKYGGGVWYIDQMYCSWGCSEEAVANHGA